MYLLEVLLSQKIALFTTGLQVTSWQPCWWSKTEYFFPLGKILKKKKKKKKKRAELTTNMAAMSRGMQRINQIVPMLLSSHPYHPLPLLPAHLSGERKQYAQNGGQYQCRGCSFWRHQKATRSREMQQRMGNTKRALLLGSYGRYYRRST